jgi:hypothetical protein
MAMVTRRMAAGAFGNDPGFTRRMLLVAVAATDFTSMGFTGTIQLADLIAVACCTQLRRCIVLPLVRRRRVGLMAAETILIGHLGSVFVVAVDTGGKLPGGCAVLAVAIVALLLGVQAGLGIHGCSDLIMAGQARQFWGVQSAEVGDDRRMRIVARTAAVKAEVALIVAAVAVAAFRDDGIPQRRMIVMATQAAEFITVSTAVVTDVDRWLMMAFNAVCVCQGNSLDLTEAERGGEQHQDKKQSADEQALCSGNTHH